MDIHENEDQLQEIEPQPGDPQTAPEPETPEEEKREVVSAELVEEPAEEQPEPVLEEDQGTGEEETTQESDSPEVLEDLPALKRDQGEEPQEDEAELVEEEVVEEEPVIEAVEETAEDETDLPADEPEAELVEESSEEETLPAAEAEDEAADLEDEAAEGEEDEEDEYGRYSTRTVIHEPDAQDGRAWYVIHCYSGNEDKVRHNILQRIESMSMDNLIFDVVVPTEDEVNIKNGERQTVEKKVFPGYILVYMVLTEESWYMVRNTPGVTGFVGMGNDPTPLQPEEVARILKRMESESPRINVTFRPGERVRIVDGPFEDFYGKVAEIDMERATVRVMVNFFGRETPVELDFLQVEEA